VSLVTPLKFAKIFSKNGQIFKMSSI